MPNRCSNSFSIKGPKAKIEKLYKIALIDEDDEGGLLQALVPMPQSLHITAGSFGVESQKQKDLEVQEKANLLAHGHKNWYDWRVTNWGTKWEVSTDGFIGGLTTDTDGNSTIEGWFESAWAPPIEAFATYCEDNPDVILKLSYNEPGMCFVGEMHGIEGDVPDTYYEYSDEDSASVREKIGSELDDDWGISESMYEYEQENLEEETA